VLRHAVGKVAVHDPQPSAVEQAVFGFRPDRDVAEVQAAEWAHGLIVVARHEHDPCALACLAQDLLDHVEHAAVDGEHAGVDSCGEWVNSNRASHGRRIIVTASGRAGAPQTSDVGRLGAVNDEVRTRWLASSDSTDRC
jgi:hypothetical protein